MKLIESINKNQIEYLKSLELPIKKYEILYYSDKSITYSIDIELNKKEFHIVITCNWNFNNGGIHIYYDKNLKENKFSEIYTIEDLNDKVTKYILKNIYTL